MFKTFVPLQKVLDLIRAKELKARKVFNKYIIEHSAIAEYIQNQKANF